MRTKRPKLSKIKRVKAVARERVGSPKPVRAIDEKAGRHKTKHKSKWRDETED